MYGAHESWTNFTVTYGISDYLK